MGAPDYNPPSGYSVAVLHKTCGLSYVAGAPRHKQRGAVFELQKEGRETDFVLVLEGEQVPAGEGLPVLIDGGSGGPRGKGTGSRAHSALGTQPGPISGRAQPLLLLCVSDHQLLCPTEGGSGSSPNPCVIVAHALIWTPQMWWSRKSKSRGLAMLRGPVVGGGGLPRTPCDLRAPRGCRWGPISAPSCALWTWTWMGSRTSCWWQLRFTTFKERRAESLCTV